MRLLPPERQEQKQIPFGNDSKKSKGNCKSNCKGNRRFFGFAQDDKSLGVESVGETALLARFGDDLDAVFGTEGDFGL